MAIADTPLPDEPSEPVAEQPAADDEWLALHADDVLLRTEPFTLCEGRTATLELYGYQNGEYDCGVSRIHLLWDDGREEDLLISDLGDEVWGADGYTSCWSPENCLATGDYNFDGYRDIGLQLDNPAYNVPFYYWFYDAQTDGFRPYGSWAFALEPDEENEVCICQWHVTPEYYTDTYRPDGEGGLYLARRDTEVYYSADGVKSFTEVYAVNEQPLAYADLDRMEKALTVGGSLTQNFVLGNDQNASLSFDYFRTRFYKTLVVDQEWNPAAINIYESDRLSYTDSYQLDFNWTPFTRFDVFATFRYTTSRMTIDRPDGTTARVERPLINQFKTLLNLSYATKFRMWVFDVTGQLNGKARIPSATGDLAHDSHSPVYPMLFAQVTHKIGRADVYLGCENITDYRQKVPIASADNPFSTQFNSMNVWGPLMGRKFYVGVRFNLY